MILIEKLMGIVKCKYFSFFYLYINYWEDLFLFIQDKITLQIIPKMRATKKGAKLSVIPQPISKLAQGNLS